MHRIDGPGHLNNRWVAEDPATGRAPTEFTAEFQNASQEELCSLIEWAGLLLNKADNTQLRQALLAKFASKAAVGNMQGLMVISSTPYSMTVAQLGSAVYFAAGSSIFNLPNMKDLPAGSTVYLSANVRTTVNAWAGQLIDNRSNGGAASIILEAQDDLILTWTGGNWLAVAGSLVQRTWHESKLDPHPQYTTNAEVSAMIEARVASPPGMYGVFASNSVHTGWLTCNGAAISRTIYSALYAAIGTTYGAGDKVSTFNIPYVPADYTLVQALGNLGSATVGQLLVHSHDIAVQYWGGGGGTPYGVSQNPSGTDGDLDGSTRITGYDKSSVPLVITSTGGSSNLAAGVRAIVCIKY